MAYESFSNRLKHAWNAFRYEDQRQENIRITTYPYYGMGSTQRPDRPRLNVRNERTIIASIYNRIAIDVAAVSIKHAKIDKNNRYISTIDSGLNRCLNLEANLDQTGREFIFDAVMSMFDEGVVALVPVDTSIDAINSNAFDVITMRCGKITQWFPRDVRIDLYNDQTGNHEEISMPKSKVAIVQNPLYAVMNEHNSTLKRLTNKLSLLDVVDSQSSGKLDLIIQLPYVIKSEKKQQEAEKRRKQIEDQLSEGQYGIAYTDGTERIIQLNRPVDNSLATQITNLTSMLYGQLGITDSILDGTADEKTMLNYYNRTIEPILAAFADEIKRKFLTKTARTQGQSIVFINDPFRLVTVNEVADIGEKFTRNEILSTNDIRSLIGFNPVDDPRADELRNKNLNVSDAQLESPVTTGGEEERE